MPSAAPQPEWVLAERRVVGAAIRAARRRAKLTQEAVALRAETDRSSVVKIEAGQVSPTTDTLVRLARAIGCPVREFFE